MMSQSCGGRAQLTNQRQASSPPQNIAEFPVCPPPTPNHPPPLSFYSGCIRIVTFKMATAVAQGPAGNTSFKVRMIEMSCMDQCLIANRTRRSPWPCGHPIFLQLEVCCLLTMQCKLKLTLSSCCRCYSHSTLSSSQVYIRR